MNDNLLDFLYDIAMVVLFVTALSLFLIILPKSETTIALLKEDISNEKAIYESSYDIEEYTVSGAEIIGSIFLGINSDMKVDDVYIPQDVDITTFDYSAISPYSSYEVSKYFDSNGSIEYLIYTRK